MRRFDLILKLHEEKVTLSYLLGKNQTEYYIQYIDLQNKEKRKSISCKMTAQQNIICKWKENPSIAQLLHSSTSQLNLYDLTVCNQ